MERDISVRSTEMTRPVKVDHLQSWSRIFRSSQTEMVRSICCTNQEFGNFGFGKRSLTLLSVTSTLHWFLKWLMRSWFGSLSNYHDGGNENVKKAVTLISKATTLHEHHAFWYTSETSTARPRSETKSWCDVSWKTWTHDDEFSFLLLDATLRAEAFSLAFA